MPAVHHYTSLKGALGILESGRLWFTERAHLNDPSEISNGIKIAEDILWCNGRIHDVARFEESAQRVFREFRFFSASFSFAYDDQSQWAAYAENGKGVLLSFKASIFNHPKEFIDTIITDNATTFVCPMSYDSGRLRSVIAAIVSLWNGVNINELLDYVFMISSMFKSDSWKSEREYRFFVHHPCTKILKSPYYKTRERDGAMVSYLDLPIQDWHSAEGLPIYRICLGPAAPDGLVDTF
jgi:hypothetical protein